MPNHDEKVNASQFDLRLLFSIQAIAALTIVFLKLTGLSIVTCIALAVLIVYLLDLPFLCFEGTLWLIKRIRRAVSRVFKRTRGLDADSTNTAL